MKVFKITFLIFLFAVPLTDLDERSRLIVWNVGQGQWVTYIRSDRCDHYDFGGERLPLYQIQKHCFQKLNQLHLSHWDQDHWGGLKKLSHLVRSLCYDPWPEHLKTKTLKPWLEQLRACPSPQKPWYRPGSEWTESLSTKSNDLSQIYIAADSFLLPGDSTIKMEKIWSLGLNKLPLRVLVLGHHGSRTSSSDKLLSQLPHLKMAISTARKKRFGHPHAEVVERLKLMKIPLLRTEDWGHLIFEI